MINKLVIFLLFTVFLQSANLTNIQLEKIKSPVVTNKNNTLIIEEYNKVIFTQAVLFDNKNVSEIIIKTKASMKKDTIHKEQFIALSSTISDQMVQAILFTPEYFDKLKTSELLVSKPLQNPDLNVEIVFTDKGLETKLFSVNKKIEQFIPYSDIFSAKIR